MSDNEFKILLGVDIDELQLNQVKQALKNIEGQKREIVYDIDFNLKNIDKLSQVGKEIEKIRTQLKDMKSSDNSKSIVSIDAKSVEKSLNKIHDSIKKVKNSLGTVNSKKGVQSLLTTVNHISNALETVSKQFGDLNRNLSNLSSKDFSFNLDFGFNNSAKNPQQAIKELNMLKKEVQEYEKYFNKFFNIKDGSNTDSIGRLVKQYNGKNQSYWLSLRQSMGSTSDSAKQIAFYKEYIRLIKETASIGKISLEPVEFRLNESGEFIELKTQANEAKEKLKELFNGGINAEGLHKTLGEIAEDLKIIRESLSGVSSDVETPIDKLTQSFNRLSEVIGQFTSNAALIKNFLGKDFVGAANIEEASNETKKASDSSTATVVQNEKEKQEAYKATGNAVAQAGQTVKAFNNVFNEVGNELEVQLVSMREAMSKVGFDKTAINETERQIEGLEFTVKKLRTTLNDNGSVVLNIQGVDNYGNQVTAIRSVTREVGEEAEEAELKFNNLGTTITQSFGQIAKQPKEVVDAYHDLVGNLGKQNNIKTKLAVLDMDKNGQEIAVLKGQLKELQVEYKNTYTAFGQGFDTHQLDTLNNACIAVGNNIEVIKAKLADTKAIKENNAQVEKLYNLAKKMQTVEIGIGKLDADKNTQEVAGLKKQLESLNAEYDELSANFDFNNPNLNTEQVRRLNAVFEETRNKLVQLDAKLADTKANFANGIQTKLDNGAFSAESSKITTSFEAIKNKTQEVKTAFAEYQAALTQLQLVQTSSNPDEIVAAYNAYEAALKKVDNQIKININSQRQYEATQKQAMAVQQLETQKQALSTRMDIWLSKNSVAAKQFGDQIKVLQKRLMDCDATQLNGIEKEFNQITASAQMAGKVGLSTLDRIKKQFSQYSTYFSVASMFSYAIQGVRSMYDNVVELDTAMTNLKKVTDETDAGYNRFLGNAVKNSKELGRSLSSYVEQSANWAKMGYDANESAELAKVSSIYSNVADVDDATAVSDIVTALKAFNIEANNAVTVIDPLNKISNEFAVTAAGLGQGLSKSASTMATAGTDLEHTLALLTGISEITQRPEEAGNFLKVAVARIQGMKGELEELGEEVDDSVDSISKVQTQILNLTHGEVNIFDDQGEFRDYYDIMKDIAEVVDDLTSTDRASLYEILFGKNRMNQGAAMIQAFQSGQIGNALDAALNSDGSAMAEQEKWAESLEASLGRLEASWESLSKTIMDSDFLRGLIEGLTAFVTGLDKVIGAIGLLNTTLIGVGIVAFIKNLNALRVAGLAGATSIELVAAATRKMTVEDTAAVLVKTGLTKAEQLQILASKGVVEAEAEQALATAATSAANVEAIKTTGGLTVATGSLKATVKGLWATLMAHPLILVAAAAAVAVAGVIKLSNAAEEASEKADELAEKNKEIAEAAQEEVKQLDELIKKYQELANSDTQDESVRKNIKDVQKGIVDLVGQQAKGLDLVNGKLDEELQKLYEIQRENAKGAVRDSIASYNTAKDSHNKAVASTGEGSFTHPVMGDWVYVGSRDKNAEKILKDNGFTQNVSYGGWFNNTTYISDYSRFDDGVYKTLDSASEKMQLIKDMIEVLETNLEGYSSNAIYTALVNQYEIYKKYAEGVAEATKGLVDSVIVASTYDSKLANINVNSVDAFMEYRNQLIEILKESSDLSGAFESGDLTNEDVEKYVDEYLGTLNKFSDYYNEFKDFERFEPIKVNLGIQANIDGAAEDGIKHVKKEFDDWIKSLSEKDRDTVYKIYLDPDIDTTSFSLQDWKNALANYVENIPESEKISFAELIAEPEEGDKNEFLSAVDNYIEKVGTLKEALEAFDEFQKGELSEAEWNEKFIELCKVFPELADNAGDLDVAIKDLLDDMDSDMTEEFADQFGKMKTKDDVKALKNFQEAVLGTGEVVGNTHFAIDISTDVDDMEAFWKAIAESASATGLTSESIKALKARYQDLESYDPSRLFEHTTHGIHLNAKALRELEAEYENQKKKEINKELEELSDKYNDLTKQINETDDVVKQTELYAERKDILDQINDVTELAAQYEGLTSAFNKWQKAQSTADDNDMYLTLSEGIEDIKELYETGWVGTDDFREAVQLMTDTDVSTASIEELLAIYKEGMPTLERFFTGNTDGLLNFLNVAKDVSKKLGKEWVTLDENGQWHIDFGVDGDKEVAKAISEMEGYQVSAEQIQTIMLGLSSAGFDINLDATYEAIDLVSTKAEKANEFLKAIGKTDYTFNFASDNIEDINEQLEVIDEIYRSYAKEDGTIVKTKGYQDVVEIFKTLLLQKAQLEAPVVMNIDTKQTGLPFAETFEKIQNYVNLKNEYEIAVRLGLDTTDLSKEFVKAQKELVKDKGFVELGFKMKEGGGGVKTQIDNFIENELTEEYLISLGIDEASLAESTQVVETLEEKIDSIFSGERKLKIDFDYDWKTGEFTVGVNVEGEEKVDEVQEKAGQTTVSPVKTDVEDSPVVRLLGYLGDIIKPRKVTVSESEETKTTANTLSIMVSNLGNLIKKGILKIFGGSNKGGTAQVTGTAYAQGDWSSHGGTALTGELGREIVVDPNTGRWFTVGDYGAEFVNIPKNAIVFNHLQTKSLLENGRVNSRGRALVGGNAYSGEVQNTTSSTDGGYVIYVNGNPTTTGSGKGNSGKEFKETIDWIEIAIERLERDISRLDLKANRTYKTWSYRNAQLADEISKVSEEINLQESAYNRYMKEANSVGLSESYAKKVRNGTINIEDFKGKSDEKLVEKIELYRQWYQKALECKDAIEELKDTEIELYKQKFDNIATQYDNILSAAEYEKSMLEEYISQSEAKGYITSVKYYEALINTENSNIKQLEKERTALYAALQDAMNNGLKKNSEDWYEMTSQIDEVTLAIGEANTALIEYNNSMREIRWQTFDLLQEKITQVTEEADFLIDLLSNDKLYDDKGQLTDEGMATMGLHGQNYNTYLIQAEKYAQELLNIDKELANDPYNQTLAERRQELLELQREMILAAEDQKQAMIDMVEEGIEIELNALSELIDKYTEALDSEKSLFDYQKKVQEQTKNISSLQKQMSAYQGDESEESRMKIQQIKASLEEAEQNLEETEYTQYISDQKQLLDDLYVEYETILNMRLDNVDALLSDMIAEINANATTISETLSTKADEVGLTLSTAIKEIWDTTNPNSVNTVLSMSISSATTTLSSALSGFSANITSMIASLDKGADANINYAGSSSSTQSSPTPYYSSYATGSNSSSNNKSTSDSNNKNNNKTNNNNNNKTNNNKDTNKNSNIFDYKKSVYPKDLLNIEESVVDRLKYNDFDASFSARKEYYDELGFKGTYTGSAKQNIQILDYLKKNGYRNGTYKLLKDEWAWTQEGRKMEAIIRPSDGAILTPLAKGDSVLKASATSNLFDFANDPSKFIRDTLDVGGSISDNPNLSVTGNTYDNDISIQIELPNVMNYEQFKYAMQHDPNFEKMVRAMTVDKMFGGSSFKKYKY